MSRLPNEVRQIRRDAEAERETRSALLRDFPFLRREEDVLAQLSWWEEHFVGVLDPEVDTSQYDSFCVFPLEELYWRDDWQKTGLFVVASFLVDDVETSVAVGVDRPGLWLETPGIPAWPCPCRLSDLLSRAAASPDRVRELLASLGP